LATESILSWQKMSDKRNKMLW